MAVNRWGLDEQRVLSISTANAEIMVGAFGSTEIMVGSTEIMVGAFGSTANPFV